MQYLNTVGNGGRIIVLTIATPLPSQTKISG